MITPNVGPILLHLFSFFVFFLGLARCMFGCVWLSSSSKSLKKEGGKSFFFPCYLPFFTLFLLHLLASSSYIHFFVLHLPPSSDLSRITYFSISFYCHLSPLNVESSHGLSSIE